MRRQIGETIWQGDIAHFLIAHFSPPGHQAAMPLASPLFEPDSPCAAFVRPSPNHGERRGFLAPDCVILHYTGMPTAEGAIARLCALEAQVSCHYFIFEDGRIGQLVPEGRRAWHAGRSYWQGERDINSASIGIEIAHPGHEGAHHYPVRQIEAVCALLSDVLARHKIAKERVLAHSDIAPGRKIDPGEFFPWSLLEAKNLARKTPDVCAQKRLALEPGVIGESVAALQRDLFAIGYEAEENGVYNGATQILIDAFQRRFRRARVDGICDPQTRALISAIADHAGL